jgi:hypothetical protein
MGGDRLDRGENRLQSRDATWLVPAANTTRASEPVRQATTGSCAKRTRSFARHRRISPRRSSTAHSGNDHPHRRASHRLRGRSDAAGHGVAWRLFDLPPWKGWTGSTTGTCSNPSATFHPTKPKHVTVIKPRTSPRLRDSTKSASGKPDVVHIHTSLIRLISACSRVL